MPRPLRMHRPMLCADLSTDDSKWRATTTKCLLMQAQSTAQQKQSVGPHFGISSGRRWMVNGGWAYGRCPSNKADAVTSLKECTPLGRPGGSSSHSNECHRALIDVYELLSNCTRIAAQLSSIRFQFPTMTTSWWMRNGMVLEGTAAIWAQIVAAPD